MEVVIRSLILILRVIQNHIKLDWQDESEVNRLIEELEIKEREF